MTVAGITKLIHQSPTIIEQIAREFNLTPQEAVAEIMRQAEAFCAITYLLPNEIP